MEQSRYSNTTKKLQSNNLLLFEFAGNEIRKTFSLFCVETPGSLSVYYDSNIGAMPIADPDARQARRPRPHRSLETWHLEVNNFIYLFLLYTIIALLKQELSLYKNHLPESFSIMRTKC